MEDVDDDDHDEEESEEDEDVDLLLCVPPYKLTSVSLAMMEEVSKS